MTTVSGTLRKIVTYAVPSARNGPAKVA
jgi:hypothetical protein